MGRVVATDNSYLEFTPAIKRGSQHLCMGVSVIGHGIGGKHIPIMARLAKGQTLE
jgi:hypothetical protein